MEFLIPSRTARPSDDPIFALNAEAVAKKKAGEAVINATVGALLDDSCRLAPVQRYATPRDFARAATALLPAPAVVVFVTGSRTPLAELRAIETAFPADTEIVAIRAERGGEPRLQIVSRLRVLTVTELGDLPKLLRRIS